MFIKTLFLLTFTFLNLSPVVILLHGTFATGENWCRPGGSFYSILEREAHLIGEQVIPFAWSGGLSDYDRNQGAQALAKVILSYPREEPIHIIGHSHGGNVAILATQILGKCLRPEDLSGFKKKKKRWYSVVTDVFNSIMSKKKKNKSDDKPKTKLLLLNTLDSIVKQEITKYNDYCEDHIIDTIYLLGTPIDMKSYYPDMNVARNVYNFYSRGDGIQKVLGLYKRLIPRLPGAINFRVTIEDSNMFDDNPSHSQIHSPILARWLLKIPFTLWMGEQYGFDRYRPYKNGKIHFFKDGTPSFLSDELTPEQREEKENATSKMVLFKKLQDEESS